MPEMLARYEFKYLIPRDRIDRIRARARMYCEPDPYGDQGVYAVNSLYLDDVDWSLARQTVEGIRNRYKLRLRTYGWTEADPVFCEIKARVGTSILKSRALIDRSLAGPVCCGAAVAGRVVAQHASHQPDLNRFRNRIDHLDLRPRVWVRYRREAWGSVYGDGARMTFDLDLQGQPAPDHQPFEPEVDQWRDVRFDDDQIILELKFNGAFPRWMLQIVHEHELKRQSVSKYVNCVMLDGHSPWATWERGDQWITF